MFVLQRTGKLANGFLDACSYDRVYGSKAITAMRAYGREDPRAQFYALEENGATTAALYLAGDVLTIAASSEADAGQIAAFIQERGVREVDTNWALCEKLQRLLGGTTESSYYMVYTGDAVEGDFSNIVTGEEEKVFDVLQRSHEYYRTHLTFDSWSADLNQKWDRGLIELYQLVVDGEVIGTGSIASEDEECACIAAVAVVPEHRHQGWGSYISRFLVQRIREKGKTPRLISGYDEVAELYRKIGFEPCGRWGELYL